MGILSSELKDLVVVSGATFMDVLEHLKSCGPEPLAVIGFMRVLQERLGIRFTETRDMYEYFDADWRPTVDVDLINERGRLLLER